MAVSRLAGDGVDNNQQHIVLTGPFMLGVNITLSLLTGIIPAVISGIVTYVVARIKFQEEIQKIHTQFALQQAGQIANLRQRYINPLRFFASTLSKRLLEIEDKFKHSNYEEVRKWFKQLKDHSDNNCRKNDFPIWCCYEGIFAMTTLYYTSSYFQSAREIRFRLPFSELDPAYSQKLEGCLSKVSEAFAWGDDAIWGPTQDVIGERFTKGEGKIEYQEMWRIMDSQDAFTYAPFFRPIDVFIKGFDASATHNIRVALDELVTFVNSRPTPEKSRTQLNQ